MNPFYFMKDVEKCCLLLKRSGRILHNYIWSRDFCLVGYLLLAGKFVFKWQIQYISFREYCVLSSILMEYSVDIHRSTWSMISFSSIYFIFDTFIFLCSYFYMFCVHISMCLFFVWRICPLVKMDYWSHLLLMS